MGEESSFHHKSIVKSNFRVFSPKSHWRRGESNPYLLDATELCSRYTTPPTPAAAIITVRVVVATEFCGEMGGIFEVGGDF